MAFHGLFVGIDRYSSSHINWLNCAARDARALHALFSDTLGPGGILLTDEQATMAAIRSELEQLKKCCKDDVVVLSFSGHGTQTHQLVTHDTDILDLDKTTISLDSLADLFSQIPAGRLICFLDCCFSGGMGAKVLLIDTRPRNMESAEASLQRLSGNGRLILTASTATQPAWENVRLGHGLLTYFLLEALCGAPEVSHGGRIPVLSLLQHVGARVSAEAARLGKPQQPTIRGQMDSDLSWPVFKRGTLYAAAFPERVRQPVSAEISSLAAYGFPPGLLNAWSATIPLLNDLQIEAINKFGLLDGEHLLVSAPTSSGKTMIGELAGLRSALERRRTILLFPLRALVNDKHQHFLRTYRDFGIRTIRSTGEFTDDVADLMRGRYDICLMTYEKFTAMILGSPHILEQAGTVVIDEVQMITDGSRGVNLEFILTLLRMRRNIGVEPQVIALSAVIGDTFGFERWMGARLLRSHHRPVPLDEGIICANGDFRYIAPNGEEKTIPRYMTPEYRKGTSQDYIIPLVRKLVAEGKQVIVFRETKGEARGCALYLAATLGLSPAHEGTQALPVGDRSQASDALREAFAGGVAFHNADLDRDERLAVEQEFRRPGSGLRVITATTTLAMGINTPTEAIIIAGLEHPGSAPYSVAEYKNMIGRAGRLGFATHGMSFLIPGSGVAEYHVWNHYVRGKPEDLHSHFLSDGTDIRSLLLRVLASIQAKKTVGMSADELVEFLHGSFGAFLQREQNPNWQWDKQSTGRALQDLLDHGLIAQNTDGNVHLTPLGLLSGQSGVEVESITRLVSALKNLSPDDITDPTLITAAQLTVELDNVLFPINKKSTQKEPLHWSGELQRQRVAPAVMGSLHNWVADQHQATLRAKKAAACLFWISDTPMDQIETTLTQHGGAFDGAAGPVRAVATRTADLLEAVARVVELTHEKLDLGEKRSRLLTRLQVGVSGKNVALAQHFGNRLARDDYRSLQNAGLGTVELIAAASDDQIQAVFGGADSARKVREVREVIAEHGSRNRAANQTFIKLPPYEA